MKQSSEIQDLLNDENLFSIDDDLPQKKSKDRAVLHKIGIVSSSVITGILLLGSAALGITSFFHHIPLIKNELSPIKYPVAGDHASIRSVSSQWLLADDLSDEMRQNTVINVGTKYIPEIELTLTPSQNSSALRIFFENSYGKLVGDPTTCQVKNGVFEQTGTNSLKLTCSAGIMEDSEYYAHKTGIDRPWALLILEGSETSNSISDYTELLKIELGTSLSK